MINLRYVRRFNKKFKDIIPIDTNWRSKFDSSMIIHGGWKVFDMQFALYMNNSSTKDNPSSESININSHTAIANTCAAMMVSALVHPFDLVKTRLQGTFLC